MATMSWLVRRLKAMTIPEILWRLSQKSIEKKEEKRFRASKIAVTDYLFNSKYNEFQINPKKLYVNESNEVFELCRTIPLLGGYDYDRYRKQWNAGFQTEKCWPDKFSYSLDYKQRDDIGDARTNWELNRHFQFALLAKDYYATNDRKFLNELMELFDEWNEKNPFLWGISWTSVMEVAIRLSNWCYTYSFLAITKNPPKQLLKRLCIGIINMTDYVTKHYSRYSSANNHLIVEAYAIGQSGVLFNYQPWIDLAVTILTRELSLQNYPDGVNKELSLHYQSFYMEAMGLMVRLLQKNNQNIPNTWSSMLKKMCRYVVSCIGNYGEVIEFGDNDEGKILDLQGGLNHYQYILGMYSVLLDERYVTFDKVPENLNWLFSDQELNEAKKKKLYKITNSVCYKEGGNSILRSEDGRVLIGIDHAELGFGSIAAHGHADALSFQMFVEGKPIFVDPGTYIYHCDLPSRNAYRKTINHNTVCIDRKDQSEMLGAFLWGKKAECTLLLHEFDYGRAIIEAQHDGYDITQLKRRFELKNNFCLVIEDTIIGKGQADITFVLDSAVLINKFSDNIYELTVDKQKVLVSFECSVKEFISSIEEVKISKMYGTEEITSVLRLCSDIMTEGKVTTTITLA